jgi:hypothetical protein
MEINGAFTATYRAIFGECNVKLDELGPYLTRYHYPTIRAKSAISGSGVALSSANYPAGRIASQGETSGTAALGINGIKDLDSIIEGLSEIFVYTGNKVFGKTMDVRESDNVADSACVYRSHNVYNSQYVAYSSYIRDNSECIFGSSYFYGCKNTIRVIEAGGLNRAFECYISGYGSDLFFCYNCFNTSNAMFCFNQKSRDHVIGNVGLPKDKYAELRKKLVDESREYLEKNKTFYSIFDFHAPLRNGLAGMSAPERKKETPNPAPVEAAFRATARVIFGRELGTLDGCGKLLGRRIIPVGAVKTPLGSDAHYLDMFFYRSVPKERMVNSDEAWELGKLAVELDERGTLGQLVKKLAKIAFYRVDWYEGTLANIAETRFAFNSMNTYRVADAVRAKNCAYDTMAFDSEAVFGCFRAIHSKFSINCHDCVNVSGCFEMDSCTDCANSMFCHNCEGLQDCMFCFNAKGLRYAIGNAEVGKEKYLQVKKLVVGEILKRIGAHGTAGFDIYDVAGRA